MSNSLQPHELEHASLRCPSLSPRACLNSCPLSRRCYLTISSSAASFTFCLQSFPALRSFAKSQLFASGGQNIGTSGSATVIPMNIQRWFPLGFTGLISLLSKGLSTVFSSTLKASILLALSLWSDSHICTGITIGLTIWTFVGKVMSLLLTRWLDLSAFLPRNKHLLISWLQSLATVILEPRKIKPVTASTFSPSIRHEEMRPDAMILVFWMLSSKLAFLLSSFTLIKRIFSFSSHWSGSISYLRLLIFSQQSWLQFVSHPAWHSTWYTLHIS